MSKPKIHLWFYNHPVYGISDQIEFFCSYFRQEGYEVTFGRKPEKKSLNVVIENFSAISSKTLIDFCEKEKKTVSIIMTEFLDVDCKNKEILMHGKPLWTNNDYMHPHIQLSRIRYLLECLPYIKSLFTLGDLPELHNISEMIPGIALRRIPFPSMKFLEKKELFSKEIKYDYLFTGFITEYRKNLLDYLTNGDFAVFSPMRFVSKKKREILVDASKVLLNIPQNADWKWMSLMRVLNGIKLGKPTISINTNDKSVISDCCPQINIDNYSDLEFMRHSLNNWYELYSDIFRKYEQSRNKFSIKHPFPHDFFEIWAITDNI